MSDEISFSKKGQRKISAFIGQELIFDYMTGELDAERAQAVENYLRDNKGAQADIRKIQNGLDYCHKLGEIKVSETLINQISMPSSYGQVLLEKIRFDQWSPSLKLGIEASVVALGITLFALIIPWHKLMDLRIGSGDVVLSELERDVPSTIVAESETTPKEDISFPDDGAVEPPKTTVTAVATTPTTTTTITTTTVVAKNRPPAQPTQAAATVAAMTTDEKRQGELYRGDIDVTNVRAITPKLVERIQELGGRKAGQVDLGWNKTGTSSYFHFTMPESRYEELLALFKEYGILKIQKEKHERVMPEGILRMIITVDEKK